MNGRDGSIGSAGEGITALDTANETSRARAVEATLTVSLRALEEVSRERFETLAVFPEDTPIPAEVLARWEPKRPHRACWEHNPILSRTSRITLG